MSKHLAANTIEPKFATPERQSKIELMRWMPPPNGITYAMMVSSEPKGGHIDDDTNQRAGDRLGEGQFPSLRNWIGWGASTASVHRSYAALAIGERFRFQIIGQPSWKFVPTVSAPLLNGGQIHRRSSLPVQRDQSGFTVKAGMGSPLSSVAR